MSKKRPAPELRLPSQQDFDPHGTLDAQSAWEDFGGLTLEQANAKFRENPIVYQEDFMFMGPNAFAFYFPVIDSYLRETEACDECDDREAWILACCVQFQLQGSVPPPLEGLLPRILDLTKFVRGNLALFTADAPDQQRIDSAWSQIEAYIVRGEPIDDSQVPSDAELDALMEETRRTLIEIKPLLDESQRKELEELESYLWSLDDESTPDP